MPPRPLSPHLSVYQFKYTLTTSILNRCTALALSVGLLLLVYWLMAVAGGAHAQARAARWLSGPLMKPVYAAFIMAFCYHLVAGIRHLVWDTGRGLERAQAQRSAWMSGVWAALLLILLVLTCGWHSQLGVRVVVEDYVHGAAARTVTLVSVLFAHTLIAAAGVFAVLKVAFGAAP